MGQKIVMLSAREKTNSGLTEAEQHFSIRYIKTMDRIWILLHLW